MKLWLQGKKTYILVVLGVLTKIVLFLSGEMGFFEFLSSEDFVHVLELLGLGTLRAGVSKTQPTA
jgi:hypothetical protein